MSPYIKQENRYKMEDRIRRLAERIETEGELNFAITKLCHLMMKKWGGRYKDHNAAAGVLIMVLLEFFRRKTGPYEDTKIAENGDIYDE